MRVIAIYYLAKNEKQVEKRHLDWFFTTTFDKLLCITMCYVLILVNSVVNCACLLFYKPKYASFLIVMKKVQALD